MNNSSVDLVSPTPDGAGVWPDVIVGLLFTSTCLCITAAYIPCLIAMRRETTLWKNSCIKVCSFYLVAA